MFDTLLKKWFAIEASHNVSKAASAAFFNMFLKDWRKIVRAITMEDRPVKYQTARKRLIKRLPATFKVVTEHLNLETNTVVVTVGYSFPTKLFSDRTKFTLMNETVSVQVYWLTNS